MDSEKILLCNDEFSKHVTPTALKKVAIIQNLDRGDLVKKKKKMCAEYGVGMSITYIL